MSRGNGKRGTKAEKARRAQKIRQMILAGMDRQAIFLAAEQLGWNVSMRTVDADLADAYRHIEKLAESSTALEFGKASARLDAMFGKAWNKGDVRTALLVVDKRCELFGLYPAKRQDITVTITDEQLDEEIARLKAQITGSENAETA